MDVLRRHGRRASPGGTASPLEPTLPVHGHKVQRMNVFPPRSNRRRQPLLLRRWLLRGVLLGTPLHRRKLRRRTAIRG